MLCTLAPKHLLASPWGHPTLQLELCLNSSLRGNGNLHFKEFESSASYIASDCELLATYLAVCYFLYFVKGQVFLHVWQVVTRQTNSLFFSYLSEPQRGPVLRISHVGLQSNILSSWGLLLYPCHQGCFLIIFVSRLHCSMQHQYFLPICWHGNHVFFIPPDLHIVLLVKDKGWIGRFDSVVISIFSTIISKRQNILGYCLKTTLLKEKLAHATGVHERKTVPSNVHTISQLREGTVFVPKHRKKTCMGTDQEHFKNSQGTL